MGPAVSVAENISEVVNSSLTDVLLESANSCSQHNSSVQNITLRGIDVGDCGVEISGISQKNTQTPNFKCAQESSNNTQLLSEFQTKLKEAADAKVSGLPPANQTVALSKNVSKVINNIKNNIDISNISTCVQSNLATQDLVIENFRKSCNLPVCKIVHPTPEDMIAMDKYCKVTLGNYEQNMTHAAVADCTQKHSNIVSAINKAAQDISLDAKSTNAGMIDSTMLVIILVVCCICCCISSLIAIVMYMPGGASSAGGSMSMPYPSDY